MTDLDRFLEVMKDFGLTPSVDVNNDGTTSVTFIKDDSNQPKTVGYHGFCADFTFLTDDGSFKEVGIWE